MSDLRKDLGAGPMSARSVSKGRTVPPENRCAFVVSGEILSDLPVGRTEAAFAPVLLACTVGIYSSAPSTFHTRLFVQERI